MNITTLIEELELDAQMTAEMENASPEDGKLSMQAAGILRKLHRILTPFAEAAEKADKASDEQKRLLGSEISTDASPGWGIKRRHLDAAREILWENIRVRPRARLKPPLNRNRKAHARWARRLVRFFLLLNGCASSIRNS